MCAHDAQHRAEDLVGVDRHVGGDIVEERGADEEALLQAVVIEGQLVGGALAAVDHQVGTRLNALADVVADPLERGLGDQRAVVGLRVQAVSDPQLIDAFNKPVAQPVCRFFADRHRDADRHAPFPGAAVTGADQRVDGLVQVGVRQDDHVVLRAAEALRALAVGGRGLVDVLRDVGAADEADGLDVGVVQDRVDGFLVALDHLEYARGQAGLQEQFGQPHRHRRVALRRLENERISACQRRARLPQRDHRREVERCDTGDHAERLTDGVDVDAGTGALGELTLEQMRDADAELDDLDAALDVALRVGDGLAVFQAEQLGELFDIGVDQFDELHHDPGSALRVERRPHFLRLLGGGDRCVDIGGGSQQDLCLHLARAGVEYVGGPGRCQVAAASVDEMRNLCGHGCPRT